jgi:hypothetical protein
MVLLAPKTNADPALCANYRILADHCYAAAKALWPSSVDANGQWVWPQGARWPIMDGDVPYKTKAPPPGQQAKPVDPNAHAWRKGNWQVEVSHFMDPGPQVAVMQNGVAVPIPSKNGPNGRPLYKGGDYGHASIYGLAYEHEQGTFGVNMCFEGILFTREGEPIGSSGPKTAEQMFGAVAQVSAPAPSYAPPPSAPGPVPMPAPPAPPVPSAAPPTVPAPQYQAAPPVAPPPPPSAPMPPVAAAGAGLPPFPGR